jgi:hypothetical protein
MPFSLLLTQARDMGDQELTATTASSAIVASEWAMEIRQWME